MRRSGRSPDSIWPRAEPWPRPTASEARSDARQESGCGPNPLEHRCRPFGGALRSCGENAVDLTGVTSEFLVPLTYRPKEFDDCVGYGNLEIAVARTRKGGLGGGDRGTRRRGVEVEIGRASCRERV